MDNALIALWERGVFFSLEGEPFRLPSDIPNNDIRGVNFSGIEISDSDVVPLVSIPSLTSISFWRTQVSDQAIEMISSLPLLANLNLCGTLITDGSVPSLLRMTSLEYLDVAETRLTQNCATELKAGLPNTEIRF